MRFVVIVTLAVFSFVSLASAQNELPNPLETNEAKASYGLGQQIGSNFARGGFDEQAFDFAAFVRGFRDALKGRDPKVSPLEFQQSMAAVQKDSTLRMQKRLKPLAERNVKQGAAFRKKFAALNGVRSTKSGLLYKVIRAGKGASPQSTDMVRVHYSGKLIDGKEFDSSYKTNEPAEFAVNEVIPGWTEALQLMKVGSKWRVALAPELGYGEIGSPPTIGPQATLIFDIELLGILPKN